MKTRSRIKIIKPVDFEFTLNHLLTCKSKKGQNVTNVRKKKNIITTKDALYKFNKKEMAIFLNLSDNRFHSSDEESFSEAETVFWDDNFDLPRKCVKIKFLSDIPQMFDIPQMSNNIIESEANISLKVPFYVKSTFGRKIRPNKLYPSDLYVI